MVNLTKNEIIDLLNQGKINEVSHGVELKRNWDKKYGEDISAIANNRPFDGGFLIVGVEDAGHLFGHEEKWLKKTEEIISNQVSQFLAPSWAVKKLKD